MKKTLAFGIVLLFIGVAFAPSFYADVETISEQQELVEYTIEFYGLENQKNLKGVLTKDKADRLNSLFDELESDLNNASSEFETITILNNCIDELNTLGFIGDNDVEEFQRIIKGLNKEQMINSSDGKDINYDCLIIGRTTNTRFLYPIGPIKLIVAFLIDRLLNNFVLPIVFPIIYIIYDLIKDPFLHGFIQIFAWFLEYSELIILTMLANCDLKIFHNSSTITYGYFYDPYIYNLKVSSGWVWTLGKNGIVKFDGGKGKLGIYDVDESDPFPKSLKLYIGAKNFKGIRLAIFKYKKGLHREDKYIGFASEVSIG